MGWRCKLYIPELQQPCFPYSSTTGWSKLTNREGKHRPGGIFILRFSCSWGPAYPCPSHLVINHPGISWVNSFCFLRLEQADHLSLATKRVLTSTHRKWCQWGWAPRETQRSVSNSTSYSATKPPEPRVWASQCEPLLIKMSLSHTFF